MALPAYDQCIKASHIFNLLDARGVISVTERQSYILRVRELAKACCGAWLRTEGGGGWVRATLGTSAGVSERGAPVAMRVLTPPSFPRRPEPSHVRLGAVSGPALEQSTK